MLIFKKLRYKNFMAVGDAPIEIQLDRSQKTLVVGQNGSGKSSIAEALTFALFNKSYRGMNKPQLINSINNRDCVVEIWFNIGPEEYYVRRGMKPNFFEIYKNGQMLNQDSAARDQQAWFEEFVLGMDFNSFAQIVTLGSALYTPFMMLCANDRRMIVENILGIEIFGRMFKVLKSKVSVWKENYNLLLGDIKTSETEQELVQGFIQNLQQSIESKNEERKQKLKEIREEIEKHTQDLAATGVRRDEAKVRLNGSTREDILNKIVAVSSDKRTTEQTVNRIAKDIRFFETTDTCRVCDQKIDEKHKQKHIDEFSRTKAGLEEKLARMREQEAELTAEASRVSELLLTIKNLESSMWATQELIKQRAQAGADLAREMKKDNTVQEGSLSSYQDRLDKATGALVRQRRKHEAMILEKSLQEYSQIILKDSGVKAQIIKNYIPIINHLVNNFLKTLNFFVKFEIDENFQEIIKSRGRDEFTYHSFSMGERTRIDLALLFTWREIARMRNSLSTNLIIFDEIGDSSLDQEGFDCFFQIINKIDRANVFVISHREMFTDKFNNLIRLEKVKNFSRIVE